VPRLLALWSVVCLAVGAGTPPAAQADEAAPEAGDVAGDTSTQAADALIVRTLRLDRVKTTARPKTELTATLIAAEPAFRPCADLLPEQPVRPAPTPRLRVELWEGGEVRSVALVTKEPASAAAAAKCLADAVETLTFPPDPTGSDERSLDVAFASRWTRPDLGVFEVSDEVIAKMDVPDPEVRGRIDLIAIKANIDSATPRLLKCIRAARKRTPNLGQRVTVLLRLAQNRDDPMEPEATLEAMRVVDSDLGDVDAEVCIVRELEKLRWARPFSPTAEVTWPFLFEE